MINPLSISLPTANTRFTEWLIRRNGLGSHALKSWIFHLGMLFRSRSKWWEDEGSRKTAHEGLDLLLYADHEGRIARLDENTRVPVMLDGLVVGIIPDFLGKTVIVEHFCTDRNRGRFCTLYAHVCPNNDIRMGTKLRQGDVVAAVAGPGGRPFPMAPHLHLSAGWVSGGVSYDRLNWESIGDSDALSLLDPLQLLDWQYRILEHAGPIGRDF